MKEVHKLPEELKSLVVEHLGYAKHLAKKVYYRRKNLGVDKEELESIAYFGLCDAAKRFDPDRGQNFETYSYYRVKGAMLDFLRNSHGLRSVNKRRFVKKWCREQGKGEGEELLSRNSWELMRARESAEYLGINLCLDDEGLFNDVSYEDELCPESAAIRSSNRRYLQSLIERLPEREQIVIQLYYFEGCTYEKMRNTIEGVSKSWLSRLHIKALNSLKQMIAEDNATADMF